MADRLIIVSDGQIPSLEQPRGSVTTTLKVCSDVFDTDGTTVLKQAEVVACELVAAETGVKDGLLFGVDFTEVVAVQFTSETTYTSQVVDLNPGDQPQPNPA